MPEPAVRLRGVSRLFDASVTALSGLTLGFSAGEITVLLGVSGSGKSTLLRLVNGLQKPSTGTVETLGVRVDTADRAGLRALRRQVAMIFQDSHLVGARTALENVCSGRLGSLWGPRTGLWMYPARVREEGRRQLARVGLAEQAMQRADTLSGGQQQRVGIARALMQRPRILLADEPVSALDPVSAAGVLDLLGSLAREEKLTVICSLHQIRPALEFGDRIIGLQAGRVVLDRPAAQVSEAAALEIYAG